MVKIKASAKMRLMQGFSNQILFLSNMFYTDEGFKDLLYKIMAVVFDIRAASIRVRAAYKEIEEVKGYLERLEKALYGVEVLVRGKKITQLMKDKCREELYDVAYEFAGLWQDSETVAEKQKSLVNVHCSQLNT